MDQFRIDMIHSAATLLCEHKIPTNFLLKLINESISAKEEFAEKIGLTQDNHYRVSINTEYTYDVLPENIRRFITLLVSLKSYYNKEPWSIIDGTYIMDSMKNKYKITKVIRNMWHLLLVHDSIFKLLGCAKLDCFVPINYTSNETDFSDLTARFSVWYGDQVKNDRIIIISINPLDILRASSNASFQSCYRPGGEQFNGVISNMLSKNVLVIAVESKSNPGYKVGRSWLYASEQIIIPARCYGGITGIHHLHIRNYIERQLGGEWVLLSGETLGSKWIETLGPSYVDNGTGTVTINQAERTRYKKIVIPMAMCLYCGERHSNFASGGLCAVCARIYKPTNNE